MSALLLRAPTPNAEWLHVLLFLAGGLLGGATARAGRAHGVESGGRGLKRVCGVSAP